MAFGEGLLVNHTLKSLFLNGLFSHSHIIVHHPIDNHNSIILFQQFKKIRTVAEQ